jgi:hypothetical protein
MGLLQLVVIIWKDAVMIANVTSHRMDAVQMGTLQLTDQTIPGVHRKYDKESIVVRLVRVTRVVNTPSNGSTTKH